jgi:hypothetical protein
MLNTFSSLKKQRISDSKTTPSIDVALRLFDIVIKSDY